MSPSALSRCGVSSLSLSALSISSDDNNNSYSAGCQGTSYCRATNQHPSTMMVMGSQSQRFISSSSSSSSSSGLRKSWGSSACNNLAGLASQRSGELHHQGQDIQRQGYFWPEEVENDMSDAMMMEDDDMMVNDEWGYFVDTPSAQLHHHAQHTSHHVGLAQW